MTIITNFYSAKPGIGCTATASRYALELSEPTLLIDWSQTGDIVPVLGLPNMEPNSVIQVTDTLSVTNMTVDRIKEISGDYTDIVIDYGTIRTMNTVWEPEAIVDDVASERNIVVLRNEYLSLSAYTRKSLMCDFAYMICEPDRALDEGDVQRVVNKPVVSLPYDVRVQRAIDAGLLTSRRFTIPFPIPVTP